MITSFKRFMTLMMIMMIGVYTYAQNSAPEKMVQGSPKDEFVKNLKDFQPKLDQLNQRAKENVTKMPEFSKEVSSLTDMVTAFKSKVDKFDATPKEQQSQLVSSLRTDWSSIQAEYKKATDMWTKSHPEDSTDKQ